jgi:hypothetical protein
MQMEEQRREMRTEQAQCVFLIIPHSRMFNHRLNLEKSSILLLPKNCGPAALKWWDLFFFITQSVTKRLFSVFLKKRNL